jgi:hypothetical protein
MAIAEAPANRHNLSEGVRNMMQFRVRNLFLLALAAGGMLAAADLPYAGKWKLNPAKSKFTGTAVTFAQNASGEMQFTAEGQSYTFKVDGEDYPALYGQTAAWKQIDANTWETTDKLNGKVLSTDTTKLSADGKTLTITSKGTKPNGEPFEDTSVNQRVSGGPGLPGKWKSTQVKVTSPNLMELAPFEGDGLALKIVDYDVSCNAKFDGKDYPATGPTVPPGFTLAVKKTGPRSFEMSEKQNGKALFTSVFSVSANGKTLTETATTLSTNEKIKVVYDRQ